MAWFDDLYLEGKGSFRDIEFFVEGIEGSIGRRNVLHEYPGRDTPFVDDNGLKARSFRIDAYVLGPDYMDDRDRLRKAIETEGPGQLIHPYWGIYTVSIVGEARVRETPRQGGIAHISFTAVESADVKPTVAPDLAEKVDLAADETLAAIKEAYEDAMETAGYIADVVQAAVDVVNEVVSAINTIKGYANAVMAIADSVGEAIQAVADGVSSLIRLPGQLADSFTGIVNGVMGSISNIGDAWDSYFDDDEPPGQTSGTPVTAPTGATPASGDKRVDIAIKAFTEFMAIGDDLPVVPYLTDEVTIGPDGEVTYTRTTQRTQEAINQDAIITLIKSIAIAEMCRAVIDLPFSSYDKALEVQTAIITELDELLEDATDITYGPLVDLRSAIVKYLASASADLPRIVEYTPAIDMPALVLAQQLYSDSSREADLVARNNVRNPCRVPAREPLEILSDE